MKFGFEPMWPRALAALAFYKNWFNCYSCCQCALLWLADMVSCYDWKNKYTKKKEEVFNPILIVF